MLRNDTHIWHVGQPDDTLSSDYPEGYKEISDYFLNKLQDKRYDMLTKLVTIYAEEHTNYRLYPLLFSRMTKLLSGMNLITYDFKQGKYVITITLPFINLRM